MLTPAGPVPLTRCPPQATAVHPFLLLAYGLLNRRLERLEMVLDELLLRLPDPQGVPDGAVGGDLAASPQGTGERRLGTLQQLVIMLPGTALAAVPP